jgi:hypothetical protein
MSNYWIIDSIKNARTIEALEVVEKWINQLTSRFASELTTMALIKKCELLTKRYCEE